jgi:uncharacterized protein DUF6882
MNDSTNGSDDTEESGSRAPLSPEADRFLAEALEEYGEKEEALERDWHLSDGIECGLDDKTCTFWLRLENGSKWEADAQILGTFDEDEETWQWAWSNTNCTEALARDSHKVKAKGEELGIWYLYELAQHPVPGPEFVAYLCSIGMKASESSGMFESRQQPIVLFIMLKNLRWTEPARK